MWYCKFHPLIWSEVSHDRFATCANWAINVVKRHFCTNKVAFYSRRQIKCRLFKAHNLHLNTVVYCYCSVVLCLIHFLWEFNILFWFLRKYCFPSDIIIQRFVEELKVMPDYLCYNLFSFKINSANISLVTSSHTQFIFCKKRKEADVSILLLIYQAAGSRNMCG